MSTRYAQFCPIAKAAELLGERWTILILRELLVGTTRFSDFQRALSQISPTLLTKRLNQLCHDGLVLKKSVPGQRKTEYQLTAAGRELLPVVAGMGEWGMKWARGQMNDDELDVELLMYDFSRRINEKALPSGRTVLHFAYPGLARFANWWIVLEENGARELCVEKPRQEADIHIRSNVRTMTEIWAGDTRISEAESDGRLALSGSAVLIRTISSWLRTGMFAHIRPQRESQPSA